MSLNFHTCVPNGGRVIDRTITQPFVHGGAAGKMIRPLDM